LACIRWVGSNNSYELIQEDSRDKKDGKRLSHHSTTINTLVVEVSSCSGEVGEECICPKGYTYVR